MQKLNAITLQIIELLAKEKCTVSEACSICMTVQRNIEATTTVQFDKDKFKDFD